jgi:hypothetical protein
MRWTGSGLYDVISSMSDELIREEEFEAGRGREMRMLPVVESVSSNRTIGFEMAALGRSRAATAAAATPPREPEV